MDWDELKAWQSGIGAILGFVALAIAVLLAYWLNRRRDRFLHDAEARSVAVSIYSEVVYLREQLALAAKIAAQHKMRSGDIPEKFARDYELPVPSVYPAVVERVGLLKASTATGLVRFYTTYDNARAWMPKVTEALETPYAAGAFLRPAISAVEDVKPILAEIEHEENLPPYPKPNLGDSDHIVDLEDMALQDTYGGQWD